MVIPYIAKTTENSLRQVPTGYREGADALGMSAGYGLRKVVLKSALPGIVTGLLLALAIACGETAPLIYTAGFSNTLPHSLTHAQFPYLTYVVFTFYNDPSVQKHYLSYDAALILVVIVLLLLVASRIVVARTQRHSESARTGERGFFTRFRSVTPPPHGARRRHAGARRRGRNPTSAPSAALAARPASHDPAVAHGFLPSGATF